MDNKFSLAHFWLVHAAQAWVAKSFCLENGDLLFSQAKENLVEGLPLTPQSTWRGSWEVKLTGTASDDKCIGSGGRTSADSDSDSFQSAPGAPVHWRAASGLKARAKSCAWQDASLDAGLPLVDVALPCIDRHYQPLCQLASPARLVGSPCLLTSFSLLA